MTDDFVQGIPQQMNGSDCGVFACKYAEYVSRGADITFSQVRAIHSDLKLEVYRVKNKGEL